MWFTHKSDNKNYLISCTSTEESFTVNCSDLVNIWYENVASVELDKRFKELNGIEMPIHKLKSKIESMFYENRTNTKFQIIDNEILKVESSFENLILKFTFCLQNGSPQMFYEKFTLPTLNLLLKMQTRETQLMDIIKTKDIELNEHKLSGQFIENKNLRTCVFNVEEFNNITKFNSVLDPYSANEFKSWIIKDRAVDLNEEESNGDIDEENIIGNSSLFNSKVKRNKYHQNMAKRGRKT